MHLATKFHHPSAETVKKEVAECCNRGTKGAKTNAKGMRIEAP